MHRRPNGWAGGACGADRDLPAVVLAGRRARCRSGRRCAARAGFQAALRGINAGVVGLLLAALYDPVWTQRDHAPADFALALAAFGLLVFWRLPPWLVVLFAAVAGAVLARGGFT